MARSLMTRKVFYKSNTGGNTFKFKQKDDDYYIYVDEKYIKHPDICPMMTIGKYGLAPVIYGTRQFGIKILMPFNTYLYKIY